MIDLKPACQRMIDLLATIRTDQFDSSSPCTEYRVGDLIDHVDQVARLFTAIAHHDSTDLPDDGEPDVTHLAPDWRDSLARHVRALGAAWDSPTAWQGSPDVLGLELPNEVWGRIALTELVVHGWDLATATGQPFDLPEPTLRACLDHVAEFVPNAPLPDLWGPPVAVAPDAPLLDRIVAITGRRP